MSAEKIDVLEVMEEAALGYDDDSMHNLATEMREAHGIVARLIDAAAGLKFDLYELTTEEMQTAFGGKSRIMVLDVGTMPALVAALGAIRRAT